MKYTLIFIYLLAMSTIMEGQKTMKLIYVGDPMCSWCYGISNEWETAYKTFEQEAEIELVMGGLRPYNQQSMTELKDFLTHHWEDVHKASGQTFSYDILDRSDLAYDTEPPSRATMIVRDLAPGKELDFFKLIQKEFYTNNKNMFLAESYHAALETLNVPIKEFDLAFASATAKEQIKADFTRAKTLGVSSFPTILVEKDGQFTAVARGFLKSEEIIANVRKVIGG